MVKMIAVWGSGGSGKKTLSLALAAQLEKFGKNSVIISTSSSPPALPVFLPGRDVTTDGSLGVLLAKPVASFSALKGYVHIHPESGRIGFMGLASGDTPITYHAFKREHMVSMLKVLNDSPFDYVIFCCQSNPVYDSLTQLAVSTSEFCLRLVTPDIQGIEFERAQTAWMRNANEMRVDQHIRIVSPVHKISPLDKFISVTGQADYVLPWSPDVYNKMLSGSVVTGCRDSFGINFDRQAARLAGSIVGQD